ncbi:hypothetical protein [Streptomyces sp. NPDC006997]|uniref:SPW repeat domain-containing protein n=1 Tax=Streptomyces sp. NPDC006997 TaxID=3155356 RepID=UPI0033E89816
MRDRPASPGTLPPSVSRAAFAGGLRDLVSMGLVAVAVWLFLGGWVLAYPSGDPTNDARLTETVVCVVVLITAVTRLVRPSGLPSDLVLLAAGGWLVAAPFALGYGDTPVADAARYNDVALGGVIVLAALVSMALRSAARRRRDVSSAGSRGTPGSQ